MKPCRKYERSIALAEVGALEPREADEVRQHLRQCPACDAYRQNIRQVTQSLHNRERAPALDPGEPLYRRWSERVLRRHGDRADHRTPASLFPPRIPALAGGLGLALAALLLAWNYSRPIQSPQLGRDRATPPERAAVPAIPGSLGEYRRAAELSLNDLDQLLARQARVAYSEEIYRVSGPLPE